MTLSLTPTSYSLTGLPPIVLSSKIYIYSSIGRINIPFKHISLQGNSISNWRDEQWLYAQYLHTYMHVGRRSVHFLIPGHSPKTFCSPNTVQNYINPLMRIRKRFKKPKMSSFPPFNQARHRYPRLSQGFSVCLTKQNDKSNRISQTSTFCKGLNGVVLKVACQLRFMLVMLSTVFALFIRQMILSLVLPAS